MDQQYRYLGSDDIKNIVFVSEHRAVIHQAEDIVQWINNTGQLRKNTGLVVATFIIDTIGNLWIADRHSEHYVCAQGKNVLSAGEITFLIHGQNIEVIEITNQSTGYCPEPESWSVVDEVLSKATIIHPQGFTHEFIFRRCQRCLSKNVVKEGWFMCGVCGEELNQEWNFD
jgi:hypothetical protein